MGMKIRSVVAGAFRDRDSAEAAVRELQERGYNEEHIGVVVRDDGADGEPHDWVGATEEKGGTGAMGGVAAGGVVGGILGAGAALVIPGVGPVLAAGILAGSVAAGTFAGSLVGPLVNMGMVEDEAQFFEARFEQGHTIVTVRTGNEEPVPEEVGTVLQKHGGEAPEDLGDGAS